MVTDAALSEAVGPEVLDRARPYARRSVLDVSRTERELGWRPQTALAEGLELTWG